jgi:hypothetical protein
MDDIAGGGTNWAIYQNGTTGKNALNADTRIGSTVAPTVPLDVTGAAKISSTLTMSDDIILGANQLQHDNDWGDKWYFAGSGIKVAMVDASKSWEWAVSGATGLLRWVWRKDGATRVEFPMAGAEAIQTAGDINILTHRLVQANAWGDKWHMAGPTIKVTMEQATASWLSTWGNSSGLRRFKWSVTRTGSIVGSLLELGESNAEGGAVFNQDAKDYDLRVEGVSDPDLLHVDASTDRVGIGTATPGKKLEVNGDALVDSREVHRYAYSVG